MFASKFDALMNIAEISNSLLSRAVNINSSHIGRLRNGTRPLPKKHDFLSPTCQFLAKHITKDYQLKALSQLTDFNIPSIPSSDILAEFLENWLTDEQSSDARATGMFISAFTNQSSPSSITIPTSKEQQFCLQNSPYFFGETGKQKAVEQFFHAILKETQPQTLLLFSDENMTWLYENPNFSRGWITLFNQVLSQGNRVKIIHSINRNMPELFEALIKWIPLYLTGGIEPYYYPYLRDGLFRRTLFIAPQTAAICTNSVQHNTNDMLNLFLTDISAIKALTTEFERYESLCKPLVRIYTEQNKEDCLTTLTQLAHAKGNVIITHTLPFIFSMPEYLISNIALTYERPELLDIWQESLRTFEENIGHHSVTEIILTRSEMLRNLKTQKPAISEILLPKEFTYTRKQYLAHLSHLHQLERKHENFKVIRKKQLQNDTFLYVKENAGAIISKSDAPTFLFTEQNIVNAFWDYSQKELDQRFSF